MRAVARPLVCIVHIPKTAGTAIRETLIASLGWDRVYWIGHERPYSHWEKASSDEFADYLVIGGHCGAAEFLKIDRQKIFVTVIREPIARAISHFNYLTRGPDTNHPYRQTIQGLDILTAIRQCPEFRADITNRQCELIGGAPTLLAAAKSISEHEWLIGCHATIGEFFSRVCQRVEWPVAALRQENVSPPGYAEEYLSDPVLDALRQINEEDIRLYTLLSAAAPRHPDRREAARDPVGKTPSSGDREAAAAELVNAAYKAILAREPDSEGLAAYVSAFEGLSLAQGVERTVRSLVRSDEFARKFAEFTR